MTCASCATELDGILYSQKSVELDVAQGGDKDSSLPDYLVNTIQLDCSLCAPTVISATTFDFSSATSPGWSTGGGNPPYAFTKKAGTTPSSNTGPSAGVGGSGSYYYAANVDSPTHLRITTGTSTYDDGTLDVEVDDGSGYAPVTTAGVNWALGDVVLDASYPTLLGVSVRNPTNNAWVGAIEYSSDGGVNYAPFVCTDCTEGSSTARIAVDGDSSGAYRAPTTCLGRATCALSPAAYPFKLAYDGSACSANGVDTVAFHYHMYGADIGELRLTNAAGEAVWSLSGNQGNAWQAVSVYVYSPSFTFEYTRGNGKAGDAAVAQVAVTCSDSQPIGDATGNARQLMRLLKAPWLPVCL